MIRYFKAFICILAVVSFASCGKEEVDIEDYEQIFDVQQFETQLNSITPLNDSTYIVGGKTGDLFKVQYSKVSDHYATSSDCIYTAFVDSNGGWWIGTRNDGLHHWDGNKPDMGTPSRKYIIPKKDTGYSVYNILPLRKDSILVGTSNGLYCATLNGSDSLSPLYCRIDTTTEKPEPVEFHTPVVLSLDSIFYPSQDGIFFVGMNNRKMWFKDKNFKALCLSPDSTRLYAVSAGPKGNDDFLWIINVKNMTECCPPFKLPFSADHLLQVHSKVYLLSRSYLYATLADDLLERDPHFSRVPLKRRLPEKTKSGFIYDRNADCIRIITERAVLTFPARNGMADRSGIMKLACVDTSDNVFYFINLQNELFKYDPRSDSLLAQKVLDLETSTADVTALHVDKETVYYEINHSSLKKLGISGKQKNGLWWSQPKRIQIPEHPKSTALLIDGDSAVYVGFKDNVLRYSLVSPDTDTLSNSHPTSLHRVNNAVVATTLNDGLFINDYPAICRNIRFQEDYCIVKDSLALLLNNHFLYLLNGRDVVDSIALKGYSRIFVSPNEYEGIAVSTDSLQWFSLQDSIILGKAKSGHIQIDGCVQKDDTLFVSTEAGVQLVYINSLNAPTHLNAKFLTFDRSDYDKRKGKQILVLIVSVIVFLLSLLAWGIWKLRSKDLELKEEKESHKETEEQLKKEKESHEETEEQLKKEKESHEETEKKLKNKDALIKESISTRIEELESANEYIGTDLKGEIEQVRNDFNEGKVKGLHKQLDDLKAKVKDELIQRLEGQSSDLKRYDSQESRDNETSTRNIIDNKEKAKIEELVACIERNNTWMDETKKLLEELESEKHELGLLPSLESIDEKLRNQVSEIEKCFRDKSTEAANEKLTNYREYTEGNLDDYKKAIVDVDLKKLLQQLEDEINSYPINKNYVSNQLYRCLEEKITIAEKLFAKKELFRFLKNLKPILREIELHHKLYELYEAYKSGKKHKFKAEKDEEIDTTLYDKITKILDFIEEDNDGKDMITSIYISSKSRKKVSSYHIDLVMSMAIPREKGEHKTTFDWMTEWDESKPNRKECKDEKEYLKEWKKYKYKDPDLCTRRNEHFGNISNIKSLIENNSTQLNEKKNTCYLAAILLECLNKLSMSDKDH